MKSSYKSLKLCVPEEISSLVPYPPGKPIEELERELGIKGSIKLASNENPFGPSKKALEAISKALLKLNRYPDGSCYYLKNKLSAHLGVPPESILPGNGSNEIIDLLVRTFLSRGDEAIMGDPCFAVYPIVVRATGGKAIKVPLKELAFDLEAMAKRITKKTKLVFIDNPNNPTGTMVTAGELREFMGSVPEETIVCIDEAYFEFARTFSKTHGLAGLRIGYGVSHPEIIDYMNRVRQPFNVNSLAQVAAIAALEDTEHLRMSQENNSSGLKYLFGELKRLNYECVPTEANFFLVKVGDGRAVYDALLAKGVIVRSMHGFGLGEYIRVTVGLPEENRRFIEAFKDVVSQKV
jgi:histidinol-phosphate aminotransferase